MRLIEVVTGDAKVKMLTEQDFHPLWWNPWMAFYCKWLKAVMVEKDEPAMRKYIRHPSDIPINFCINDTEPPVPHVVKDVSVGGLCFSSNKPLPKGTRIHIHIPLVLQALKSSGEDNTSSHFDADGIVAWCRRERDSYAVGVQFADASTQFGLRMVEQVCHIEHYRFDVLQAEGRVLTSEEAAQEWVERYAAEFPH